MGSMLHATACLLLLTATSLAQSDVAADPDVLALRDPERRAEAIERLVRRGPAVAALLGKQIEATAFEEPSACRAAAQVLIRLGSEARDAVPHLEATKARLAPCFADAPARTDGVPDALGRLDIDVRLAIASVRLPAEATNATLRTLLGNHDPWVQAAAAHALGRRGEAATDALADLVPHAHETRVADRDFSWMRAFAGPGAGPGTLRREVVTAIAAIDPAHPLAVDGHLVRLCADSYDPATRAAAAHALGLLGGKAKPAVPKLISAAVDADRRVAQEAVTAIGAIGVDSPAARAVLTRFLRHADPAFAGRAAVALAQIDSAGAVAARARSR